MTELLKALLFGIVEGVTEWLPVSSTGHMILLNELVSLRVSAMFMQMFLVVIQLGAIMAVVILYWNTIWPFRRDAETGKVAIDKETISLWGKIIVACLPAAVVGILADDWLDVHFYNWQVVSVMLILVGIAFIVVENKNADHRPLSADRGDLSRHLPVGRDGPRRNADRNIPPCRDAVYLHPGDPGHVRRQPAQDRQIRDRLFRYGAGDPGDWNDHLIYRFRARDPVHHAVYPPPWV